MCFNNTILAWSGIIGHHFMFWLHKYLLQNNACAPFMSNDKHQAFTCLEFLASSLLIWHRSDQSNISGITFAQKWNSCDKIRHQQTRRTEAFAFNSVNASLSWDNNIIIKITFGKKETRLIWNVTEWDKNGHHHHFNCQVASKIYRTTYSNLKPLRPKTHKKPCSSRKYNDSSSVCHVS